jgi:hypothetical protein
MQEKISDICLRFGSEYSSLENPPMGGPLGTDIPVLTATYDRYYHSRSFQIQLFQGHLLSAFTSTISTNYARLREVDYFVLINAYICFLQPQNPASIRIYA